MEDDDAAEDVVRNDDVGDEDVTGEFVLWKRKVMMLKMILWRRRADPKTASLRSRNAHGHVARADLCDNSQEKCSAPDKRRTF